MNNTRFHSEHKPWLGLVAGVCMLAFCLAGCHTPALLVTLPTIRYANDAEALDHLTQRQNQIQTLQAQATLRLTPPQGKTQTLDAQLVHITPHHTRLRASKLNHNVFDLTVTPEAAFVAVSKRVTRESPDAQAGLLHLARALPFLIQGPPYTQARVVRGAPNQLNLAWDNRVTATLDSATLTPLVFKLIDDQGQTIILTPTYTLYQNIPWLQQVSATGPFGTLKLTFYNVALNDTLNPRAFTPPRRATRHPLAP